VTDTDASSDLPLDLETASVADVTTAMADGRTTAVDLVHGYLERIDALDRRGPAVHAVRCLAPDAEEQAAALDRERAAGSVRGPLHGVPVLVKDNIDVAGLPTTGGALALEHSVPAVDAGLVARLREAGAVVLGKTNLTEMANFLTEGMPSGYSSLGGQVLNPYDVSKTPCGSSSGSGAAAALGLATLTVGTETDGSIICPCDAQSLVGVKPTLGLVPGDGILPIATSQDCAGPMTRTVRDAALLLAAMSGRDLELVPDALRGARLVLPTVPEDLHTEDRDLFLAALDSIRSAGATVVDVPALAETDETPVLHYEFARDVDAYLARLPGGAPMRSMADLATWNSDHATEALKYGQKHVLAALEVDHERDRDSYLAARALDRVVAGEHGIDAVLDTRRADAVVTPSWHGAGVAARAGYPSVVVPAGYRAGSRAPFGVTLLGRAGSETRLLSLALAVESALAARRPVSQVNPSLLRG
jgi:amidase